MDNNLLLIGGIVVAVAVIIIVALVVIGRKRKESKTISFEPKEEKKELTQQEKSGNYQAVGGFNFAPAQKEPVPAEGQELRPGTTPQVQDPARDAVAAEPVVAPDVHPDHAAASPAAAEATSAEPAEPEQSAPRTDAGRADSAEVEVVSESTPEAGLAADKAAEEKPEEPDTAVTADPVEVVEETEPAVQREAAPAPAEPGTQTNAPQEPAPVAQPAESDEVSAEPAPPSVEDGAVAEAADAAEAAAETQDGAEAALEQVEAPAIPDTSEVPPAEDKVEDIAPAAGRLGRLRGRLARSQNMIGSSLLDILSAGDLDEDAWEEIEDTLIMADLGTPVTMKIVDELRQKIAERGVSSEEEARAMLRETLIEAGRPELDRSVKAMPYEGKPAVVLVVGVNGTGKTTTTGKLARVLVSMGHHVVLGAADTFRAAAADQLETWGRRVGATTVRGAEGADPASVAFDSVAQGIEQHADVVLIDTAGRLHTSRGLMDQLGKVKRVVEKRAKVDEVLLVLDATVGQNGIMQARTFAEVVDITGVVLTKLDGTAKGGIVFQVQEELGVPVKLVGLGEGADDLAPFEVEGFVDALLG